MKKTHFIVSILFISGWLFAMPHAWINEFHYDNDGTDRNEFVEVIVEHPDNYYLGDLVLYMYNGYDGVQYCLDSIDEFVQGEQIGDFRVYTWFHSGIQNDTEGMLLVFRDTLIDILAYEGSFTGSNTPADGLLFPDIGVRETGSGPDSCSLYLEGMPGSDWIYGPATPGYLNTGQTLSESSLPLRLMDFNAKCIDNTIHLSWQTASETETLGFRLFRNSDLIAYIDGRGYSSSIIDYSYIDKDITMGSNYKYTLMEVPFSGKPITLKTLCIKTSCLRDFGLGRPFPNPANPCTKLKLNMYRKAHIKLEVFDLFGRRISILADRQLDKGEHMIPINIMDMPSGEYIVQCESKYQNESMEFIVMK